MKMSPIRYAFAHNWPTKIYLGACSGTFFVLTILACRPSLELFKDWQYVLLFIFAVVIAPVLGFYLVLPCGFLVLGPLYRVQERRNGGPFKPGDRVRILVGAHRGKSGIVQADLQQYGLRVTLASDDGNITKSKATELLYSPTQLLRERSSGVDERMVERDREPVS